MKRKISILLAVIMIVSIMTPITSFAEIRRTSEHKPYNHTKSGASYKDLFLELHEDITNSGYYSPDEGIPYHSIETMLAEAPDYGHVTTSEALSYYVWLEAVYGKFTGDWSRFNKSWDVLEYLIPSDSIQQAGMRNYNPSSPATYAAEHELPDYYPSQLEFDKPVGSDPVHNDLTSAYGPSIYLMHWLMDVDNWYGFGRGTEATFINTFQRGEQESTWETIPHPSIEEFKYGGPNGFLDLFTIDNSYSTQWRFTNAPDAEARTIQGVYWANKYAKEQGKQSQIRTVVEKATKMGDFVRNNFFDKYFYEIGSAQNDGNPTPGTGYNSAHYLLAWYTAWGGGIQYDWSWKIGCSHAHFGYQSPFLAWIMSTQSDFAPKSANGKRDWETSLERQLEFYTWLQSADGAIAGGATNSWKGRYERYPSGKSTFYGMAYVENPVYADPGSNTWFGMQAWSMLRMVDLYLESGNKMAEELLDKWVPWVLDVTEVEDGGTIYIPSGIDWSGEPDTWTGRRSANSSLRVEVTSRGQDLGVAGALANCLITYAAAVERHKGSRTELANKALKLGKDIVDTVWTIYRTDKGVMAPETRGDFHRFFSQEIYVPSGWSGKMPNGDEIKPGVKFIDIRSKYKDDPMYDTIRRAYEAGEDPEVYFHRYWAQVDYALAISRLEEYFPDLKYRNTMEDKDDDDGGDVLLGDINSDGVIDSIDATLLSRLILEIRVNNANRKAADINQDGEIDTLDYSLLSRHVLEISPIRQPR
ncbi:glycoside hydrolase family 48 protein [Acetivibrio saccincola]|nr:glycoside hydrolase family 48 protein [Acetivibrio saccincola]